ncbi:MAG: hypothetical protein ACTTJE_04990 [Schwartzia sp. (in: firmicutes)]
MAAEEKTGKRSAARRDTKKAGAALKAKGRAKPKKAATKQKAKPEQNAGKAEQKAGKAEQKAGREKKERVFRFTRSAKQNEFLNALVKTGTVKGATALSGISRASHYRWLEDDAYQVGLSRARQMAADLLEDEAWRRAVEGDERPIYNKHGEKISSVRYYSDRLLEKLLAANLPEKYKERIEETVVGDGAAEFGWEGEERDGDEGRGEEDHDSLPAGKAMEGEDSSRA